MQFTLTYQGSSHPRTRVVVEDYADLSEATAHALEAIESSYLNTQRVLIRMGDAAHTDPIVWDSDNHKAHTMLNQAIINRVDNMLADLAVMQTRMRALKEDIHNLLGNSPKV